MLGNFEEGLCTLSQRWARRESSALTFGKLSPAQSLLATQESVCVKILENSTMLIKGHSSV